MRRSSKSLWSAPHFVLLVTLAVALTGCSIDCAGDAYVWEDANCDGRPGQVELPIQGVCIWFGDAEDSGAPSPEECTARDMRTGGNGRWSGGFFAGCGCGYIHAETPAGYQPTTSTAVEGCRGEFGFARVSTCPVRSATALAVIGTFWGVVEFLKRWGLCLGVSVVAAAISLIIYKRGTW
jgi:hypothetical protein